MRLAPVLPLSALSGAAALIYEIVWFQLLELTVGSTAVSLAVLLATFMGGTCLGSLLFPRLATARWRVLRVYAALELGIGALGIGALFLIPHVGAVYTAWSGYGLPGFLLRGAVAAVCLLPPTLLMGATLPSLSRWVESEPMAAPRMGFLYAANIAGAVLGCLLAGFYLLRVYDASTATYAAAGINLTAAAIAWALPFTRHPRRAEGMPSATSGDAWAVYLTIAISGCCALGAEAIWTRLLGLLLGASVYAFAIIVAVFLAGLGIGSGIGSLISRGMTGPRRALGWCQLLAACSIAWTAYSLGASLPYWPVNPAIGASPWFSFQLDLDRAFWALLPPTLFWGASFPLALEAASSEVKDGARLMGGIYAANTLGAIAGALGASLVLIGRVGSQHAQQTLMALSLVGGVVLLFPARRMRGVALPGVALGAVLVMVTPPVSKTLIAYGRYAATWAGKSDIIFAAEGMNSSVAVASFLNGARTFHVAGKVQASNVARDMRLQRMLGHLTTLASATPRSVLVIGCGAGITAGAVSIDPRVERETIAEIEPLVPQTAAEFFGAENFDVIQNPKVQVRIDDGRHYLLTSKEKFDGITIDPLDPWVKGAANLYTQEFYEAMKQHLNPGGTVTMYIQLFETNLDAVKSAVATFFEAFPHGTVWGNPYDGQGHDMVLLGQAEPLRIDLDQMELRFGYRDDANRIPQSLAGVGMNSPEDLFATYAGRASDLKPWLKDAAINRDGNLRMQYLAGLGLDQDDAAAIYAGMLRYRRFPEDIFSGTQGRVDSLRDAMQRVR